ncbi:MAG: selenocysteine-specific translation elongation factor [candidate division WOR-3 bacterium]|nr:MAG: selenocysteine-specific translation elongation factor [candidate division WOR-3 bacterium]
MTSVSKKHIVIGTAGHIDHGKSALVKALTGVDPDRLKEEKERGMTTDLGFVFYNPDVTIIDVPGHEKFVRHMVAGASTIDFVIFVVAADDGVMPQTYEHLEILKLLGIQKGLVVITKKDLVEEEMLEVVKEDVKTILQNSFLEDAPIMAVSNVTKDGIETLRKNLDELIAQTKPKTDRGIFRMPIDRRFVIKGFGTVVAGTVLSGRVAVGGTLELLPEKKSVKVRGIEVHNEKVEDVTTGFRAAINLVGAEKEEIDRGDVLAQPGYFEPSEYLNASLYLLKSAGKPLKNFTRLRIHVGTSEIFGRVVFLDRKVLSPGEKAMAQFRLEAPAVCDINDNYVIRTYSPQMTIGGGVIIEPKATKAKGFDEDLISHLHRMEIGEPIAIVEEDLLSNFDLPRKIEEISHDANLPPEEVRKQIQMLTQTEKAICLDDKRGLYYHRANHDKLQQSILEQLKIYHKSNPTGIGVPNLELLKKISRGLDKILLDKTLTNMQREGTVRVSPDGKISLSEHKVIVDDELDATIKKIEHLFLDAAYKPPGYETILAQKIEQESIVKKAYRYMLDTGTLVNVGEGIVIHERYIKEAQSKLIEHLKQNKEIRVSQFRDLLGASRKFVLPLLIYFDTRGVTIKRGDVRVLGQKYK